MKKPFPYTELSDQPCAEKGCPKKIKKNLIARKENTSSLLCYRHYKVRLMAWRNRPKEMQDTPLKRFL